MSGQYNQIFKKDDFDLESIVDSLKEKRSFPRINATLPVEVSKRIAGETIDLSETGLRFALEEPIFLSKTRARIKTSPNIDIEFKVVWNKHFFKGGRFTYGVRFINLDEDQLEILRDILFKFKSFKKKFILLTKNMRTLLESVKNDFDRFDALNKHEQEQVNFIEANKKKYFKEFDAHFNKVWETIADLDKESYSLYQRYYQHMLHPLMEIPVEINRHIYRKPLGYGGDFMIMNYIYDYHGNRYLGKSSFEKFINNYTCNIPITCSNIKRKEFFKAKILEVINKREKAKIMSIGCGPIRELIELLKQEKIKRPLLFRCLDFEKRALDYVKNQIEELEDRKKHYLTIEYIHKNIISLIKDKKLKNEACDNDFIYISGVFDYLSDRLCARLIKETFQLLNKEGILIVCNASAENYSHRAYYELLGEWNMFHRTKKEMLSWVRQLDNLANVRFEEPQGCKNYLFLTLQRL